MSVLSLYARPMMSVQGVDVDVASRRVWRDGVEIRMSNKEFDLLRALISRPGEIVTREELMRDVWQTNFWTSAKTIDVHLGWVRKKLGDDTRRPSLITTIRGRGLRFEKTAPVYADLPVPTELSGLTGLSSQPEVDDPVERVQSAS
jgi:DNA-binding response OmpR family regulator